jgi:hypothetical protein
MRTAMLAGIVTLYAAGGYAHAADADAVRAAVDKGVAYLRGILQATGGWPADPEDQFTGTGVRNLGPTALVGLTLLECGAPADDKDVAKAADFVRRNCLAHTQTYAISLSILFLDRLGDPADARMIQSLTIRLLAGQKESGGWWYICPPIPEDQLARLTDLASRARQLVGRREPLKPGTRRKAEPISREFREQLALVQVKDPIPTTDNSNTQFATLALWAGRRYGIPIGDAAARLAARFRDSQRSDGGWIYVAVPGHLSTGSMTCAGILGLEVAHGVEAEGEGKGDIGHDANVHAALARLALFIEPYPMPDPAPTLAEAGAGLGWGLDAGYFLWTVERTCVLLDLPTLADKDWYDWGCKLLLRNQAANGSWPGKYQGSGADTCFALLFLMRANLARDLTGTLRSRLKGLDRSLRSGGVGGRGLKGADAGMTGRPRRDPAQPSRPAAEARRPQPESRPTAPPQPPPAAGDSASERLADDLVKAPASERDAVLEKLRAGRGVEYTEALASAIGRLEGEHKQEARKALAQRLVRMKPETLSRYLRDEDPEIRSAAAVACVTRELKTLIPQIIPLLRDRTRHVAATAHAALKELSGQDLGTDADAWQRWWDKHGKD